MQDDIIFGILQSFGFYFDFVVSGYCFVKKVLSLRFCSTLNLFCNTFSSVCCSKELQVSSSSIVWIVWQCSRLWPHHLVTASGTLQVRIF